MIWVRDERGLAYHWAGQLASRLGEDQNAATRKNLGRAAFANGVEKFAQHDPRLVMVADGWNSDPMLLAHRAGQWTCERASFGKAAARTTSRR